MTTIHVITAKDIDGMTTILGVSVDLDEAERFVYIYNLGNPMLGAASLETFQDLRHHAAWMESEMQG